MVKHEEDTANIVSSDIGSLNKIDFFFGSKIYGNADIEMGQMCNDH